MPLVSQIQTPATSVPQSRHSLFSMRLDLTAYPHYLSDREYWPTRPLFKRRSENRFVQGIKELPDGAGNARPTKIENK
jgi:hypothetical protein